MTHVKIGKTVPRGFTLDVDFDILPGITAVYGSDGSGKTQLLETIAGFSRPNSGRILLEDVILFDGASHVHLPPRRRSCGFISQANSLFPHLTVRQNLVFPARRWPRLERHRRVTEMLDKFQLTGSAGLYPRDLHAADKLRCAAARALIAEPKLLLVDECGMDESLLLLIHSISQIPLLFATSNLDLCCAVADQMLLLSGGRIMQQGTPRQVLDQPASVETARLLAIPNLFQASIAALDPGRNNCRLQFEEFSLTGPYIPGHFKGDRVWVAAAAEDLRVHSGQMAPPPNSVAVDLVRASHLSNSVLLEFSHQIRVRISRDEFVRQQDNKDWRVEFPPEALRVI